MAFAIGFLIGILVVELSVYWLHRLQHWSVFKAHDHGQHHLRNEARGVMRELAAYYLPASAPIIGIAFAVLYAHSEAASFGWVTGVTLATAINAFVHEAYHTNPNLIFWTRPVHHFHHSNKEWQGHNFAFTNTLLDRLFGTFKDDPAWVRKRIAISDFLQVRWI